MSNEIVKAQANIIVTMDDAERAAKAMASSGYFKDAAQLAQAVVKILAGQEMGFGPFASMNGINIIQGRPSVSANLMAAAVKRSGRYNYRVAEMTDKRCAIVFFEAGQQIGESVFTDDDAKKAGTQNMGKFPRNMLFARAMSNGVRWYCPDVFSGSAVYTPEELGAVVDGEGNVVSTPEITVTNPVKTAQPAPAPADPVTGELEAGKIADNGEASTELADFLNTASVSEKRKRATELWRKAKGAGLNFCAYTDDSIDEWIINAEAALAC